MYYRGRDREKRRERDVDRKRSRKSPSPGRRSPEPSVTQSSSAQDEPTAKKKKEELDPLLTRTGGAYIPPAKLRMMQEQITDKNRHVNITKYIRRWHSHWKKSSVFQLTLTLENLHAGSLMIETANYTSFLPAFRSSIGAVLNIFPTVALNVFNFCMNEWKSLRKGHISFFCFYCFQTIPFVVVCLLVMSIFHW